MKKPAKIQRARREQHAKKEVMIMLWKQSVDPESGGGNGSQVEEDDFDFRSNVEPKRGGRSSEAALRMGRILDLAEAADRASFIDLGVDWDAIRGKHPRCKL